MKKITSKIISFFLIATLVFTSSSIAFAGSEDAQGEVQAAQIEKPAVNLDQSQQMPKLDAKVIKAASAAQPQAAVSVPPYKINTLTEYGNAKNAVLRTITVGQGTYAGTATLELQKGTVEIYVNNPSNITTNATFSGGIYTDPACTTLAPGSRQLIASKGYSDSVVIDVPVAATYYFKGWTSSAGTTATVNIAAYNINGNDRAASNNQILAMGQKVAGTKYIQFKAPYTGYVHIDTLNTDGKVTLLSSSKKALSNAVTIWNGSDYYSYSTFGVKKGATYYFAMNSSYIYSTYPGVYFISPVNKKVTEKSGSKKSKAVTIKKKKTKKGTITAGSGKADWYKLKYKSGKSFKVTVKGYTNDKIKYTIYKGKKKIKTNYIDRKYDSYIKFTGRAKGTYYIKVYRANSTSSGYYSVTWK